MLAKELGRPLPAIFAMSRRETAHWIAYYRRNPEPSQLADAQNALLCSLLVATRIGNQGQNRVTPDTYMMHPANRDRPRRQRRERDRGSAKQAFHAYGHACNAARTAEGGK